MLRGLPIPLSGLLLSLLGCAPAGDGGSDSRSHKVGVTQIEYRDERRQRPLASRLWYPAVAEAGEVAVSYDRAFKGFAARGADYLDAGKRRPLILLSHGDKGSNANQAWLAEALAGRGYIVAAVNHWLNTTDHNTPAGTVRVWERPRDLSVLLDKLLADPVWGARVAPARIGAAGHSSGGYTALALAGAVYAPRQMLAYCQSPEAGPDCKLGAGVRYADIDFKPASRSYRDSRIKAVFAMAPALGPGMTAGSLRRIDLPVHIVAAEDDELLHFDLHASRYAEQIPGAELTALPAGGHFVFMPRCTFAAKVFTYFHRYDICGHRAGIDRAPVHADIARRAAAFFRDTFATGPGCVGGDCSPAGEPIP